MNLQLCVSVPIADPWSESNGIVTPNAVQEFQHLQYQLEILAKHPEFVPIIFQTARSASSPHLSPQEILYPVQQCNNIIIEKLTVTSLW